MCGFTYPLYHHDREVDVYKTKIFLENNYGFKYHLRFFLFFCFNWKHFRMRLCEHHFCMCVFGHPSEQGLKYEYSYTKWEKWQSKGILERCFKWGEAVGVIWSHWPFWLKIWRKKFPVFTYCDTHFGWCSGTSRFIKSQDKTRQDKTT